MFRRCDGIGRRAGLKIQSWRQGAGSTPATGTKTKNQVLDLVSDCRKSLPFGVDFFASMW